jgi:hypothetical protein
MYRTFFSYDAAFRIFLARPRMPADQVDTFDNQSIGSGKYRQNLTGFGFFRSAPIFAAANNDYIIFLNIHNGPL